MNKYIMIGVVAVVLFLVFTVGRKAWWMKRLRKKFHLPWNEDKDQQAMAKVKLASLIRLVRTDIDFQGGDLAQQGPPSKGQDARFHAILKEAGFTW